MFSAKSSKVPVMNSSEMSDEIPLDELASGWLAIVK